MTYGSIQEQGRQALQRAILDTATKLLVERGVPGLSLRRIADEVGCSTTVLYTRFGNKQGMVDAVIEEGFDRLWQQEASASTEGTPLQQLASLADAYRAHALASPDYYRVMFGGIVPGADRFGRSPKHERPTFQVLIDRVQACIDAGIFRPEDPKTIARVLWSAVHGVVSLEIAGEHGGYEEATTLFQLAMKAVASGFLVDPSLLARNEEGGH